MLTASALWTSLGPQGRSKILRGPTGVITVSKDGGQMIEHILEQMKREGIRNRGSAFEQLLLQSCLDISKRYGDGALSTALLMQSLMQTWALANPTGPSRVRKMLAIQTLLHVVHAAEEEIREQMLSNGCWRCCVNDSEEGVGSKWIRALWVSALFPALNASSALVLEKILWRWVGQVQLHNRFNCALDNYDSLVVSVVRDGINVSESYCLPADELIIDGNMRDSTSLTSHFGGMHERRFICVQELLQRTKASTTITANVVIESTSLTHIATMPSGRLVQIKRLMRTLADNDITVVFCCDRVEEAELFEIASSGVVLMDCIPTEHLQLLSMRGRTPLWGVMSDFLDSDTETIRKFGVLSSVDRIRLGKSTDASFRISGLRSASSGSESPACSNNGRDFIPQLVLICSSTAAGAIYNRLLRRCLLIAVSSARAADDQQGDGGGGMSGCIVPGAGAGDMAWSVMWQLVSESLARPPLSTATPDKSSLAGLLRPLAESIASRLQDRLEGEAPLLQMVSLCRDLSVAYTQPAWHLLSNTASSGTNVDRLLLRWRHSLLEGSPDSSGKQIGTEGLITSLCPNAESSTFLQDCFEMGVVTSATQFWTAFLAVLEGCRLYLRTGGEAMHVKKLRLQPPRDPDSDDDDT